MADLPSPLRGMRGPFLSDPEIISPEPFTIEQRRQTEGGPLSRGLQSTLTSIDAGSAAKQALSAELSGQGNVSALRARAGELAMQSEQEAPATRSYTQVDGVNSGIDYLMGGAGSIAPYIPAAIGGAAAARVLGPSALRAITPTLGAAAGIYPMEKGQAVLDQYMDPVQAAAPAEQRDNVATVRAAINAGLLGNLSSNVITGIAGRSLRGFLGATAEGALPNTASAYVSQKSQEYLNPNRDTSHDNTELIDAAITGGALGAAAHVPSGFSQAGVNVGRRTAQMAKDAAGDLADRFRRPDGQGTEDVGPPSEPLIPGGLAQDAREFMGTVNERVVQPGMQAAADMFNEAKPKAKEAMGRAGDYVDETVKKFNEAAKEAEDFPDFVRKAFSDEETDLENLAAGDKSPEFKKADGSIDEEKLFASDEPRRAKTEQNANDMMNDPDTSEEIRQRVRSFNGDYSSPEAQTFINNARLGQRSAQRARDAIKTFKEGAEELLKKAKDSVPGMKKAAGDAIDNAKDAIIRKNKQDPKLSVEVESAVFRNLRDELQAQPAIIKQVPELAKVISKLLGQGASIDDASLKAFGKFHALNDLFADPAKAMEKIAKALGADDLYKRSAKFSSAFEDSKRPDSMLFKAVPMERRDEITAPMLKKLGRFIDELSGKDDKTYNAAIDGLAKVYGDREAAIAVVDYYTRANESELKIDADKQTLNSDDVVEGTHDAELANQGIQKQEIPTDVVFASVDKGVARPFHRSEMKRLGEAILANRGPTGEGRREKMSTYAWKEGKSYVGELDRIERDIKQRIVDHKAHKEYAAKDEYRLAQVKSLEDQLAAIQGHKDTVNKDAAFAGMSAEDRAQIAAGTALEDFFVARMKGEKADKTMADDEFIRDARFGYSKAKKDTREANKDQFVEFVKTDGKTLTLHAPSMVRAMSRRQKQHGDETDRNRGARLFKEAVAAILERPDIAEVKGDLKKVRFEKEATVGAADAEQQLRTSKIINANNRFAAAQDALDKVNLKTRETIAAIKAGEMESANWARIFGDLSVEREALKAKMAKAREDGADIKNERSEKQEREESGLTDIVKDILDKEGGTRLQQEMGRERRENDLRTTSPGKYAEETPHDIKKALHLLKKQLEEPGTPAEKKRIRDEMAVLTRRLRVVEAAQPKNTETLRERAERNARREAAAKERTKKALDDFVGKDEEPELRGPEAPGSLGDPDKTRPDYLKKSNAKSDVGEGPVRALRSAAYYGKEELEARAKGVNAAIDKFVEDFNIPQRDMGRATVNSLLRSVYQLASKGTFSEGEFSDAAKTVQNLTDKLGSMAFNADDARPAPKFTFEEIIGQVYELRKKVFQVLVPMSRKTEAHIRTLVDEALGKDFRLVITPYIDGSAGTAGKYGGDPVPDGRGGWLPGPETISISSVVSAVYAADPDAGSIGTVHHEIMHAIASRIERTFGIDALKQLVDAVHQDHIKEQVFKAVEEIGPGYRKYLEENPEEMFVEAYAQWRMGAVELKPVDKRIAGFFARIKAFVKSLFNLLEKDDLVRAAFEAAKRGEFKDMPLSALDAQDSFHERTKAGLFKQEDSGEEKTSAESRFSKENAESGRDMTAEEADAARAHILKTRGPDVQVITDKFAKDIGGSGSYYKDNIKRVIEIARDALNPLSVAHHESMHDFFHTLLADEKSRRVKADLLRAADIPYVQAQLRALLRDHPDALEQVKTSPEERLSYMYQFWAAGKLRVSPTAQTIFSKVLKWLRDVLGVVSAGEKGEAIMSAFHNGKLTDPSTAGAVIADLNMKTVGERLEKLTGPVGKFAERLLSPATERLHSSDSPALRELAEMFHKEPGRESGGLAFLQKRGQMGGKFANKLQDILGDAKQEDLALTLKELQSMQPPTTELGKNVRKLLDDLHDYMTEAGVMNSSVDPETKKVKWDPIRKVKDYFPRVWDRASVRAKAEEFKALLMKEGEMREDEAEAIFKSVVSGDGLVELAENEHHVGFTPYSSAVKNRGLTFIRKDNAHLFEQFQNKDLVNVMHTYIYQAAHRGEYSRVFGNDGEKIKELLMRAKKEGATEEEVMSAAKTVRALEGTLGADINPRLRELYSGIVGYENIVLLPFAIFSSFVDPLGVAVRSGKLADAAIAFKDGMKGIAQDLFRMTKDGEYEMARTIGVIDDLNKMEAMGQVMTSQYMSGWMRKFNDNFFKWNGMETWNERMRVSAMGAGMRFMVRSKDNARYMDELGLKSGDIVELPDGKIARTMDEGLTKEQEQRVQEAIYRFVDGAILRPNAAHRPPWASDPHFMLVAHLKQYTFSFQQTILKQVKKEFQNGNNMPAFVLASYIPFMAASDLMRGSITGSIKSAWTLGDFIQDGVARSGVLGTGSFVTDAMTDASKGKMPGSSFLGPAAQHMIQAIQTVAGAANSDWNSLLMRSVPASPFAKAVL